jgi:hypothetical protein
MGNGEGRLSGMFMNFAVRKKSRMEYVPLSG